MGTNELSTEMIKTLENTEVDALHTLLNKMYDTGEMPFKMAKFILITLPKKSSKKECKEHCTIFFMYYIIKFLLRVIMHRIQSKLPPEIVNCQWVYAR